MSLSGRRASLLWMFLLFSTFMIGSVNALAASSNKRQKKNNNKSSKTGGGSGFGAAPSPAKTSVVQSSYVPDTSEATRNLMAYLMEQECEGIGGSSTNVEEEQGMTEIGFHGKTGMRGLFATDDFQAGEFLLGIPFPCCLALSNDDIAVEEASDAELGRRLMVKMQMSLDEQKSEFHPYFQTLPTPNEHFDATPDFWTDQEIEALEFPPLIEKVKTRKLQIQHLSESQGIDLEPLQFATWLVKSRGFTLLKPVGGTIRSKTVLMPFLDMINHNAEHANAELQVLETKAEEESLFALQAIRPISKGKEITISYGTGQDSTLELLSNYGFIPAANNNPNDIALIQDDDYKDLTWSTTLKEDEQQLAELLLDGRHDDDNDVLKKILQFRIRMKHAAKSKK